MALYSMKKQYRQWPRRILFAVLVLGTVLLLALGALWSTYHTNLQALDNDQTTYNIIIPTGSTPKQIGNQLKTAGLIKSPGAFEWYIRLHGLTSKLQAGTYSFKSSMSVPQMATKIAQGRILQDLLIILPSQRLDQIKDVFLNAKFSSAAVEHAFDPAQYSDIGVLADKPAEASLEGYLYPDTFQKDITTDPSVIVRQSLEEMDKYVTAEIKAAFASEGLSVYQGLTLASVVEQEVSNPEDRTQVAQVFLSRLKQDMPLGSDVTYFYAQHSQDNRYDKTTAKGLPYGPISNVTESSLNATAHPASTDWLYFVTGDDGTTHFSHTLDEHNAKVQKYCHKLCGRG